MKIITKQPQFSIISILFASYLVNVFYLNSLVGLSRMLTWGVAFFNIGININRLIRIINSNKKFFSSFCVMFLILVLLIAITPIIHGTGDFSYFISLFTMIGTMLNLTVVMLIADKYKKKSSLSDSFMNLYMITIVLYVLFTTLCILVPAVKSAVLSTVYLSPGSLSALGIRKYATRIGWAGFSGYSLSLKCSMANIFALYFFIRKYVRKEKQNVKYFLFYMITLLGEFYYSRTGLIVSILVLLLSFIFTLKAKNILSVFWASVFVIIIVAAIPILQTLAMTNTSLAWMLEPFLNLLSHDGFTSTSSSNVLNNMVFRLNADQLLWGDGMYTGPYGYYMKTDLGFMRLTLYFGVPGLLLTYSLFLFCLLRLRKNTDVSIRSWYFFAILCAFSVFEFKGEGILLIIPMVFILAIISNYDVMEKCYYDFQMIER